MKFAEIFTNSLVLQANKPIRIFGEAESDVTVTLAGESVSVKAVNGRFLAELPAMPYGGAYELTVESGEEKIALSDVYVGEVILFSGQSNMQFHMSESVTPECEYADDSLLRIFVSLRIEDAEKLHPSDGWTPARLDNIGCWSALAYLVGRRMRTLGCAVGVVACSQGASVIQSWIDEKLLLTSDLNLPDELLHRDRHDPTYSQWNAPGTLFHYMLEPMIPFGFGNVVWYQGESNTSPAESRIYVKLLEMMISNWRGRFMSYLPFSVVQIADYKPRSDEAWKLMQKAQLDAQSAISGVKTVICADVCENDDIHPKTKWKLADRIFESLK